MARTAAVVAVLLQSLLLVGIAIALTRLIGAFVIDPPPPGDTEAVTRGLTRALSAWFGFGVYGLSGLIVNLIAVITGDYRERWYFWSSLAFAVAFLPLFPGGTLLGLAMLVVLLIRRRQFFGAAEVASAPTRP